MIDVKKGLDIKNMPDLIRRNICGIYKLKNLTKKEKEE